MSGDDDVLNIGLNRAVTVLAEAKTGGGRRGPQLLRELGAHPDGGTIGLYRGRYGPYVGHDGLIASLPRGADPDTFTLDASLPLLAAQKAKGKTGRKARPARAAASSRSAPATAKKSSSAKKPARRKAPAKSRKTASDRPASRP